LAYLLSASTIGGYILAHEIIWLLFERGSFNAIDTINSAFVLQMYMIGLLPLGLQKLFLLWLYANEQQMRAAKIATFSLLFYIVFALTLITPMGAAGLALAGTIGGFVGFVLTIKAFGVKNFFSILASKKVLYLIAGSILFTIFLIVLKSFIDI
jgi:putative peptidoglycan lipid II flippase